MSAENFAMRLFENELGGCSPFHNHPWEHEIFILEGEGIVVGAAEERSLNLATPFSYRLTRNTSLKIMATKP